MNTFFIVVTIHSTVFMMMVMMMIIIIIIITISKSLRKYMSNIRGKHEVKELQKTAILGTAHTYCGKY